MSFDSKSASPTAALPVFQAPENRAPGPPLFRLEDLAELLLRIQVPLDTISLSVREILDLRVGTVVELDKVTGETFEVTANGTPVARGEVRVQGERFALRITEILRTARRSGVEGEASSEGETGL